MQLVLSKREGELMKLVKLALVVCACCVFTGLPPPPPALFLFLTHCGAGQVMRYRGLLNSLSKNTSDWAAAARDLRLWMMTNDPDYPLYHLAAPEGWNK